MACMDSCAALGLFVLFLLGLGFAVSYWEEHGYVIFVCIVFIVILVTLVLMFSKAYGKRPLPSNFLNTTSRDYIYHIQTSTRTAIERHQFPEVTASVPRDCPPPYCLIANNADKKQAPDEDEDNLPTYFEAVGLQSRI